MAALPEASFVATIVGDELPLGMGKPDPEPYLRGAAACAAHPADCVAIEDSPTGVRSALGAGCRVLGVPNVKQLEAAPGVTVVASLEDVRVDDLSRLFTTPSRPARRRRNPVTLDLRTALIAAAVVATLVLIGLMLRRDDGPPPLPPGAVPIDVWAPYWTLADTLIDADARFDEMREVSPFWFGVRQADAITTDENAPLELADTFFERARDAKVKVVPSIRDEMPAGGMAAVLADPTTRSLHIRTILDFADRLDADGIDLDYEQFAFADGPSTWEATSPDWVAFVAELAAELHDAGRTLTVSIPPVYDLATTGSRGYWVYDHGAIAEHVDAIRIMAYDYSVPEAGPIAPLAWVGDAITGTSLAVAPEFHHKLVLGVPAYGTNWVVSTVGDCPSTAEGKTGVTALVVDELAARRGGVPMYDEVTAEWSFTYALTVDDGVTTCVQNRRVHWVDAEGVAARTELARRAGWGGVALWALGYEDQAVWDALVLASQVTLPAEPAG